MPMVPSAGVQSPQGFGPGAADQLGTGGYAAQDAMAGDPTDPSAQVQMSEMPQMAPTSIAEAIQAAVEQRQAAMDQDHQAQKMQLLQSDLQEADAFVQQLMSVVGAEATTADGGAAVAPAPMGVPEQPTAPGGTGMGAAMSGLGPAAPQIPGAAGIPPEALAGLLGG